ncbi:MAG: aminotransferase class III-fold pyridoxal phosphate-dependent enzyme [Spirochaetes bacterium]|nr:aminotransferase class III-fold pyridoxal phosphate-dependent enzyme [Spirochaetota bacterium]
MGLLDDTYEEAKKYMVMGVASSGKYNKSLGKSLILKNGDGCKMTDLDGNEWIDYHTSSGASILGYNHPAIKKALLEAVEMGHLSYMETEYNLKLGPAQ